MKKATTSIFVMLSAFNLCSQGKPPQKPMPSVVISNSGPTRAWIGIFGGPNLNYLDYYNRRTTIEGKNIALHAGVFYQRKFSEYFAFRPELVFVVRGGRIRDIDSTVTSTLKNIEVSANFLYLYKRLIIGAGPNFCYGVNGILKTDIMDRNAYSANESFERTLRRFELGGNFLIGYTFKKGIFITCRFSPGFTDIYKGDDSAPDGVRAGTRIFGISLGYLFAITNQPPL